MASAVLVQNLLDAEDDAKMADAKPVPETLETLAEKIGAIATRLDRMQKDVETQFAETRSQLGVKIEAVDEKVTHVYDEVMAQRKELASTRRAHEKFTERLDDHDLRILALEHRRPRKSSS